MTNQEIRKAAEQTQEKYDPLLTSKKTALMVYAREQKNMVLLEKKPPSLDIENIVPDMNNVELTATVEEISKFTYSKDGEQKKGCEITLKDETGRITMMVWQEKVEQIKKEWEKEKVEIRGAYSNKYKGETQVNYGEETTIKPV